jgi:hypothetical protein
VVMAAIEQELLEQFKNLDAQKKKQVLQFVHRLGQPKGELVSDFLQRTRDIRISPEDIAIMKRFAEEDEERIDWDDWNNPSTLSD